MRSHEFITEGATDVLYHATGVNSALEIIEGGKFLLSISRGNPSEEKWAPKGYDYYLSTARSKVGDYHRYTSNAQAMFVIDGQWLSQRYPVKPIDYWEGMWKHSPDRTSESEDRVFSKKNTISIGGVRELHVLLKPDKPGRTSISPITSEITRRLLIASKARGIPTYFYTDENSWKLQDKRRTTKVADATNLRGHRDEPPRAPRPLRGVGDDEWGRHILMNWIELIKKTPGQKLSARGEKLAYDLRYRGDQTSNLRNELQIARKPSDPGYRLASAINDYLNKYDLRVGDLVERVKSKWSEPPR